MIKNKKRKRRVSQPGSQANSSQPIKAMDSLDRVLLVEIYFPHFKQVDIL